MFTGEGFSLISGFRKISCSQEMDSVLIQVSRKFHVHQRNLYLQCSIHEEQKYLRRYYCLVTQDLQGWLEKADSTVFEVAAKTKVLRSNP